MLILILSAICGLVSFALCFTVYNYMKKEQKPVETVVQTGLPNIHVLARDMLVRLAVIEVYPEYLEEYLEAASKVGGESVEKEPGVVCIFPMQVKEESNQIRILEIYRNQKAYESHLQTEHFLKYKNGTLHMVKSLELQEMQPLDPDAMWKIFKKFLK